MSRYNGRNLTSRSRVIQFSSGGDVPYKEVGSRGWAYAPAATLSSLHEAISNRTYKTEADARRISCCFLSLSLSLVHSYCLFTMDAIKSILSPLGMNTGALQDTLVSTSLFPPWLHSIWPDVRRNLLLLEGLLKRLGARLSRRGMALWTVCHSLFQSIPYTYFCTAFFLTAHFSQEDYPYDWYYSFILPIRTADIWPGWCIG